MQCPKCQFDNTNGMNFCGKCGTKLERFCPQCKFGNPSGYEFCENVAISCPFLQNQLPENFPLMKN